jgi:deoxyribodipyrimidine photolyase
VLWREFFYCAATNNPNFDKMVGNPICVQIPWDSNAEALAKWANASYLFNKKFSFKLDLILNVYK